MRLTYPNAGIDNIWKQLTDFTDRSETVAMSQVQGFEPISLTHSNAFEGLEHHGTETQTFADASILPNNPTNHYAGRVGIFTLTNYGGIPHHYALLNDSGTLQFDTELELYTYNPYHGSTFLPPENITAIPANNGLSLYWQPVSFEDFQGYTVEYKLQNDTSWTVYNTEPLTDSHLFIDNLQNNVLYQIRIKAHDSNNATEYSAITQSTPEASGERWRLLFRHDQNTGGPFDPTSNWLEANISQLSSPNPKLADKYSILGHINNFSDNETYYLKLVYPEIEENNYNIWSQTKNPLSSEQTSEINYTPYEINFPQVSSETNFSGIKRSGTSQSFLTADINSPNPQNMPIAIANTDTPAIGPYQDGQNLDLKIVELYILDSKEQLPPLSPNTTCEDFCDETGFLTVKVNFNPTLPSYPPVDFYIVEYSFDLGASWFAVNNLSPALTSFNLPVIQYSIPIMVRIKSSNLIGESPYTTIYQTTLTENKNTSMGTNYFILLQNHGAQVSQTEPESQSEEPQLQKPTQPEPQPEAKKDQDLIQETSKESDPTLAPTPSQPSQAPTIAPYNPSATYQVPSRNRQNCLTSSPFTDLAQHWISQTATKGYCEGWIKGYPDGTLKPRGFITRAEMVTIAHRAFQITGKNKPLTQFSDVDPADWYYHSLKDFIEQDLIQGYPDGTFRPHQYVTSAEALKIALYASGQRVDTENCTPWYKNCLDVAMEKNLVLYYYIKIVGPSAPIERAQVIKLLDQLK